MLRSKMGGSQNFEDKPFGSPLIIVLDVYLLLGKSSGIAVMRRISHRLGNCDHFDLKHFVLEALIKGKFVMLLYTGK